MPRSGLPWQTGTVRNDSCHRRGNRSRQPDPLPPDPLFHPPPVTPILVPPGIPLFTSLLIPANRSCQFHYPLTLANHPVYCPWRRYASFLLPPNIFHCPCHFLIYFLSFIHFPTPGILDILATMAWESTGMTSGSSSSRQLDDYFASVQDQFAIPTPPPDLRRNHRTNAASLSSFVARPTPPPTHRTHLARPTAPRVSPPHDGQHHNRFFSTTPGPTQISFLPLVGISNKCDAMSSRFDKHQSIVDRLFQITNSLRCPDSTSPLNPSQSAIAGDQQHMLTQDGEPKPKRPRLNLGSTNAVYDSVFCLENTLSATTGKNIIVEEMANHPLCPWSKAEWNGDATHQAKPLIKNAGACACPFTTSCTSTWTP